MMTFSQSELSDDIIFEEILTRLPVKSVVRFKSASKKWYSTLSSCDFATAHLNKSPFSGPCAPIHTLFMESRPNYYLFSFDDDNRISGDFEKDLVKLDVDFGVDGDYLYVIGSCNGLICVTPEPSTYFILWNPATRKLCKYDSNGFLEGLLESYRDTYFQVAYGFGYATVADDYKFVIIVSCQGRDGPDPSTVHVFSWRRNKWTKLDFDLSAYYVRDNGILVDEKLYWVAQGRSDGTMSNIVSFDLGAEKLNIFHYPDSGIDRLGIMGECLCKLAGCKRIDILIPPTILKSITLPKVLQYGYGYEYEDVYVVSDIVGFTRDGKFLVSMELCDALADNPMSSALYLVNIDTEPLECSMLMELEVYFKLFKYVPSLISPFPIVEP